MFFGSSKVSPEQKDDTTFFLGNFLNNFVRKGLPPNSAMRIGLVSADGETGVEKEYALLRPMSEIPVRGDGETEVVVDFFVNILEAWRDFDSFFYGKTESMGLPDSVIRVLSEDDDVCLFEWAEFEGFKYF